MSQALPLREHVQEIADLLNEVVDPAVQVDASGLKEIVQAVQEEAMQVHKLVTAGQSQVKALQSEMQDIHDEHSEKIREREEKAKKYEERAADQEKKADKKQTGTIVNGVCSTVSAGGAAAAIGGAVAGPGAFGGGLLATAATAGSSGWPLLGWGATAAIPAAFTPVGLVIGTGLLVGTGVSAVAFAVGAVGANNDRNDALELQRQAQEDADEYRSAAEKSKQCKEAAGAMLTKAKAHEDLWRGIFWTSESAAHKFSTLKKIDPSGARRKKFNDKMKGFASDLLHLAQAGSSLFAHPREH